VYRLKRDFADYEIIINGGINSLDASLDHLQQVDGVMLGREPYKNPFMLHNVDPVIFGEAQLEVPDRIAMLQRMYPYIEQQLVQGLPLTRVVRHLVGLFHGEPNGRRWRRYLSENAYHKNAGIETLQQAVRLLN
jgi:tRNA-dihydrouridine synthase A